MNLEAASVELQRALEISRELAAVADHGDVARAAELDAERLALLRSARAALRSIGAMDAVLLQEIAALNHRAIGSLEHRKRAKARDLDTAAAGRRALVAYSANLQKR